MCGEVWTGCSMSIDPRPFDQRGRAPYGARGTVASAQDLHLQERDCTPRGPLGSDPARRMETGAEVHLAGQPPFFLFEPAPAPLWTFSSVTKRRSTMLNDSSSW